MKTRFNGLSMVAVGLASLATLPACLTGEDEDLGGVPVQPPADFPAPQTAAGGDSSKACSPARADQVAVVQVGSGFWGSYATCMSYCPAGSYTYHVQAKSEAPQGGGLFGGDDTALNGVRLNCGDLRTGASTGNIDSQTGGWGSWGAWRSVDPLITGNPFVTGRMRIESPQAPGVDDTAANGVQLTALSGSVATPPVKTSWGDWQLFTTRCPSGSAICGINTRVEGSQGSGDDTALNGISFACCSFAP